MLEAILNYLIYQEYGLSSSDQICSECEYIFFALSYTYFHNSKTAGTIKIGKHIFSSRSVFSDMQQFSLEDLILLLNKC